MSFWLDSKHIKAVLFDLDDTLFDHKFSRLNGLLALQEKYVELKSIPIEELEQDHEKLLSADYIRVLDRKISADDAVIDRIKKLCAQHGLTLDLEQAKGAGNIYSKAYIKSRRAVPGSYALLNALKKGVVLGIITNGLVQPQIEKLRACKIADPLDFIVISEAVGVQKPDREIFELALRRAIVRPSEAVYVGDSWSSDILPAVEVGMKAVWLNRYGLKCPDANVAREVTSLTSVNSDLFLRW